MSVCETDLAQIQTVLEPIGQRTLEGMASNHLLANDICRPRSCEQLPPVLLLNAPTDMDTDQALVIPRVTPL